MEIISTGEADILLVDDLPIGARSFDIEFNSDLCRLELCWLADFMGLRHIRQYRGLPRGYNYTIVGIANDVDEIEWIKIMPSEKVLVQGIWPIRTFSGHCTAKEAGFEFLKSQGILLDNPYPDPKEVDVDDETYCNYHSAQSKVKNPLVIKAEKIT